MDNLFLPQHAILKEVYQDSPDVKRFKIALVDARAQEQFSFVPGQYIMLSIMGVGEAPFDICSDPHIKEYFEITVRKAGLVTSALHGLAAGEEVGVRGPLGKGFPSFDELAKKDILLVGGGIGIITVRSVAEYFSDEKTKYTNKLTVFYGARSPADLLYEDSYEKWGKRGEVLITIDKEDPAWKGHVGLITTLFDKTKVNPAGYALLCGPPIMYKFVVQKLKELGFKDDHILVALERNMNCGLGLCQKCGVGDKYVCVDGPVFTYEELKKIPGSL
jgi:NAD(P)H-flavin reductase